MVGSDRSACHARASQPIPQNPIPALDPGGRCIYKYKKTEGRNGIMDNEKFRRAAEAIARNCVGVRLRLLNRVVTNLYDDALRPLGLKVTQLHILVVTAKLGVAQPQKVCDLFQLDASTLSRNVERMRARDWLEVVPAADARTQSFRLTPQGRRKLEQAFPVWEQAQQQAEELLGVSGVALLAKLAGKIGGP
jgi:DNA-binding MarR family transcriptional regulator